MSFTYTKKAQGIESGLLITCMKQSLYIMGGHLCSLSLLLLGSFFSSYVFYSILISGGTKKIKKSVLTTPATQREALKVESQHVHQVKAFTYSQK